MAPNGSWGKPQLEVAGDSRATHETPVEVLRLVDVYLGTTCGVADPELLTGADVRQQQETPELLTFVRSR